MAEEKPAKDDVAKSKTRMIGAIVALLLVAVAAGAFALTGGIDMVADLIAGTPDAEEPAEQPAEGPAEPAAEPVEEPAEEPSEEPTETAGDVEPASDGTVLPSGSGDAAAPPAATAPTLDQQNRMYAEQVWSQEQIGNLVAGKIASFSLGSVSKSGSTASVRVTANYKSGPDISGTMVLRDYGGTWYFSSITRDGHTAVTPGVTGDSSVLAAIMTAQQNNQDIPKAIVSGGHTSLSVDGVSAGSGTASIKISLSGGTAPRTTGTITCISKDIGGVKHWFITSFARN
ncbi:MAG: Uncharacterized protein XD74_1603 [Actinobacteria bacterium 66_15]|nr:MAG: Uncharacterized protein XD74_1603 [Actinobacteria bacterium 66_15]